jgi:hypothetical protein
MTPRPDGSAVPTGQRPCAGRTLVAFWVFAALLVAAMVAWLQLLGPPLTTAGTARPVATSQPQASAASTPPEPSAAASAAASSEVPAAAEQPAQSSAPAESTPKSPSR